MELIDRNELEKIPIRESHYDRENGSAEFVSGIETVIEYARQLPKVDAVPAVQCGECKHNPKIRAKNNCPFVYDTDDGDYYTFAMGEDGFCSKGEPRTPPAE